MSALGHVLSWMLLLLVGATALASLSWLLRWRTLEDRLDSLLEPGERVLWTGSPDERPSPLLVALGSVVFSLGAAPVGLFILAGLFVAVTALDRSLSGVAIGNPLTILNRVTPEAAWLTLGAAVLFASFVARFAGERIAHAANGLRARLHVVTEKRLIELGPVFARSLAHDRWTDAVVDTTILARTPSRVRFLSPARAICFAGLRDPAAARAEILEALERHGGHRAPRES